MQRLLFLHSALASRLETEGRVEAGMGGGGAVVETSQFRRRQLVGV